MSPNQVLAIHVWQRNADQAYIIEVHTVSQILQIPIDEPQRHMLIHRLGRPKSEAEHATQR